MTKKENMFRASFRIPESDTKFGIDYIKKFLSDLYVLTAYEDSQSPETLVDRLFWHYEEGQSAWLLMLQSEHMDSARWFTGWVIFESEESWNLGVTDAKNIRSVK